MQTMEEYANWVFHFIEDKLTDNPSCFFRETAFYPHLNSRDKCNFRQAGFDNDGGEEKPESLD